MQQGSPLKDQFNNAILELLNKRQLEKLKEQWWKNDELQSKCDKPEDQSDGISIQNIGGVFIVIFGNITRRYLLKLTYVLIPFFCAQNLISHIFINSQLELDWPV